MYIERGSLVLLDYDLLLDSGNQIDSSAVNGQLKLRVGEWHDLPGLAEKLVGLSEGYEGLVRLTPEEGFGVWDPNATLTVRTSQMAGDAPLRDGMGARVTVKGGPPAICRVYRIMEDRVLLDFNHPFAGEPLTLYVHVREVTRPDSSMRAGVGGSCLR